MTNRPTTFEGQLQVLGPAGSGLPPGPPDLGVPPEDDRHNLQDYLDTVVNARGLIIAALFLGLVIGGLYFALVPRVYQADVVVQVEERKVTIAGMENLASMSGSPSLADTETEILRSRMLVGTVVDDLNLDIVATPRFLPLVGRSIARLRDLDEPGSALLGLTSFAWGGESIVVRQFDVPRQAEEKWFTLIARGGRAYDLVDPTGATLGSGEVGTVSRVGRVTLLVSSLTARDHTHFELSRLRRDDVIEKLQKDLVVSEKGKRTGVIQVTLKGHDRERLAAILNGIAQAYVRQNVDRRSAEAQNTLQFINAQLPQVKANLDRAEAALNEYRTQRGGGLDLSQETRSALDRAAGIERMLTETEMQRSEYRQKFAEGHPSLAALNRKAEQLRAERASLERQLKELPETEINAARLTRDVKVASELYVLMVNKSQELQVMKSGTIGNVRIVDLATVPHKPVSPHLVLVIALSLALGAAVGVGTAFVRKALDRTVVDPEAIERGTGLPVYATIPHSRAQEVLSAKQRRGPARGPFAVLATEQPGDLAVEALRSLRTSLQFALLGSHNNVVTVTGPSPSVGKSFVCVNMAHVLASVETRVLLIDADLRKGQLHHYFNGDRTPGLADLIRGKVERVNAVRPTGNPNLHFMSMGTRPPNPSELLSSSAFQDVIAWASIQYDLVLVDTPPVLAVTDAALVARVASTTLLVLKAGQHPMREIAVSVKLLAQNGARPRAVIVNDLMPRAGYGYSRYEYT